MMKQFNWKIGFSGLVLALSLVACSGGDEKGGAGNTNGKPENGAATEQNNGPREDNTAAQIATDETKSAVRDALGELVTLVQNGEFEQASQRMVYRGSDADRAWQEPFNYQVEEDKLEADKMIAQLQAVFDGVVKQEFKEFAIQKEAEGEWHIWSVDLQYGDGKVENRKFAFLPIARQFRLGDID